MTVTSSGKQVAVHVLSDSSDDDGRPILKASFELTRHSWWACRTCTLHNDAVQSCCEVCGAARPDSTFRGAKWQTRQKLQGSAPEEVAAQPPTNVASLVCDSQAVALSKSAARRPASRLQTAHISAVVATSARESDEILALRHPCGQEVFVASSTLLEQASDRSSLDTPAITLTQKHGSNAKEPIVPSDNLAVLLRQHFGIKCFRPGQRAVVEALCTSRDALFIFPTGGGKSLCYQLPALVADQSKFGVVISPLIALMDDQVQHLNAINIPAAALHSERTPKEKDAILKSLDPRSKLTGGESPPRLIYLSPELALCPSFQGTLQSWRPSVALVAIDEAHCVSKWGHDFRPCYRQLGKLRSIFVDVPFAACTATATVAVRNDITDSLRLRSPIEVVLPFDRPNLQYEVINKDMLDVIGTDVEMQLVDSVVGLVDSGDTGIVYCQRQRDCEFFAQALQARGVSALPYHAGLPKQKRQKAFEGFLGLPASSKKSLSTIAVPSGLQARSASSEMSTFGVTTRRDGQVASVDVLVATIAFGMGVDKADVRFIFHAGPPKSLSAYYQESGRAGRDGKPAKCVLYYRRSDLESHARFAAVVKADRNGGGDVEPQFLIGEVEAVKEYCDAGKGNCRRQILLKHFGDDGLGTTALPELRQHCCDLCTARRQPCVGALDFQQLHTPGQICKSLCADIGEGRDVVELGFKQLQLREERLQNGQKFKAAAARGGCNGGFTTALCMWDGKRSQKGDHLHDKPQKNGGKICDTLTTSGGGRGVSFTTARCMLNAVEGREGDRPVEMVGRASGDTNFDTSIQPTAGKRRRKLLHPGGV
eukprot:TRINITY_DN62299_c0_g1_i1.p1 TRINITY_DN62299_c0_g1~~TRINITY_DN62299_c0_g1_i1.p1  ORF type:complete len:823 (-),score=107.78 TRINITY_DN62299_c0_g1_i1:112-2580(-)